MISVVTGSEGFIGKHLCRALIERGDAVIGLDLKTGRDIRYCNLPAADQVFHLAAQTDAYSLDARTDASLNIEGSLRVFNWYRDKKVVFSSSAMVNYPTTPYAISKRACEEYAKFYGVSIVRLCNVTGPGGHSVFEKFESAEQMEIFGTGNQLRTYTHVSNVVKALIGHIGKQGIMIVKGEDLTVNEIANEFANKSRCYLPARPFDMMDARQLA